MFIDLITGIKHYVKNINDLIVAVCQILAIFVISVGIVKALIIYIKDAILGANAAEAIKESRLELGHSFSLGLGFLIGGSILRTTLAPTWDDIGQLAAVIAIRTILNTLLLRDIHKHGLQNIGCDCEKENSENVEEDSNQTADSSIDADEKKKLSQD